MLRLLLLATLMGAASAMCPDSCSGHGTCGCYDMCTCYAGYQGNDCASRTCPSGFAFVTTHQGDLNMDGDRYDNTQKLLVKLAGGASNLGTITENDNTLYLSVDVQTGELIQGDAIRIADETFVITATTSGKIFELDHDRFTTIDESNVYKFLETIPAPKGTWESWQGDYTDGADEGHYYMECSNRGDCDRKAGQCECYEGYTGSACQRQKCPDDCSGHGTCEKVSELRSIAPVKMTAFTCWTGTEADLTTQRNGVADSSTISCTSSAVGAISIGDTIRIGTMHGQDLLVTAVAASGGLYTITISEPCHTAHAFGSTVYHVPSYDLWDADMDRKCVCDGGFTGTACADRQCPMSKDPLCRATIGNVALDGATPVTKTNEKQTIYLDTMRGSLSGTFTLTFTDDFGQKWTTAAIYVNERLSSKAFVDAADTTIVTFSPSLPFGELDAGDFLMIGDERHEVSTAYPIVSSAYRPQKLGGVVDSVVVRNGFAAASQSVWSFRAGPAKGIKAALEGLPNGVVKAVTTEAMAGGQLIGFPAAGIATADQVTTGGEFTASGNLRGTVTQKMSTLTHIHGQSTQSGHANIAEHNGKLAGMSKNGGLAPYDTMRVVAAGGFSEYVQVRNVDVTPEGDISVVQAKGSLTALASTAGGIGQGKNGAMYRAGGYAVRVSFTANPGNLDEMETDTDGLYSVFVREFAGTVNASNPRVVQAHLHGDDRGFSAAEAYPVPVRAQTGASELTTFTDIAAQFADATTKTDDIGLGDTTSFKGDVANLKVMAGMKIKMADQVRTVVADISGDNAESVTSGNGRVSTAYFVVDEPFTANAVSETVDNVDYIFYRYQVEQLYDEATYNAVTMSVSVYKGTETWTTTTGLGTRVAADKCNKVTTNTANGGTKFDMPCTKDNSDAAEACIPALGLGQAFNVRYPIGSIMTCSGHAAGVNSPYNGVLAWSGSAAANLATFSRIDTSNKHNNGVLASVAQAGVCRRYVLMSTLSTGTGVDRSAPPLDSNSRTQWATVTDQRPLVWSTPDADLSTKSRVTYSASLVAKRGVVAGGSNSITLKISAANTGATCSIVKGAFCIKNTDDKTLSFYVGTGSAAVAVNDAAAIAAGVSLDLLDFIGESPNDSASPTEVAQTAWLTISGCSANSGVNRDILIKSSATSGWVITSTFTTAFAVGTDGDVVCAGNTVTLTTRMGTLQDSKAIAIGDRVKFLQDNTAASSPTYETRTVDKVWGTNNDVTMFSVVDAYTNVNLLADALAWVDEAGSTVSKECSGRGICEGGSGDCECFKGYTGVACETQNALKG